MDESLKRSRTPGPSLRSRSVQGACGASSASLRPCGCTLLRFGSASSYRTEEIFRPMQRTAPATISLPPSCTMC